MAKLRRVAKPAPICSCPAKTTLKRTFVGFRECPTCKRKYELGRGAKWFYLVVAALVGLSAVALFANPERTTGGNVAALVFWVGLPVALLIRSARLPKPEHA